MLLTDELSRSSGDTAVFWCSLSGLAWQRYSPFLTLAHVKVKVATLANTLPVIDVGYVHHEVSSCGVGLTSERSMLTFECGSERRSSCPLGQDFFVFFILLGVRTEENCHVTPTYVFLALMWISF